MRVSVCVCVCMRERERVSVSVCEIALRAGPYVCELASCSQTSYWAQQVHCEGEGMLTKQAL